MKQKIANSISLFLYRYLGVICIILILFDFFSTVRSSLIIMQSAADDGITPVKSEVENKINNALMLGSALAKSPFFSDTSISLHDRALRFKSLSDSYGLFLIGITDVEGTIYSSYDYKAGTVAYRTYFKKTIETGKAQITDIINAGVDGITKNFTVCVPYFDKAGKVAGTIILSIYLSEINDIVVERGANSKSYFILLDSQNDIVSTANKKILDVSYSTAAKLSSSINLSGTFEDVEQAMKNREHGAYWNVSSSGFEYTRFAPVAHTDWTLLIKSNVASNYTTLFQAFLMKSIIYILLFGFLSLRKNKAIFYRDKLYNIVAEHIDDVFLIYNLNTSSLDYISTNVERVLGLPHKKAMGDIKILYSLLSEQIREQLMQDLSGGSIGNIFSYESVLKNQITGAEGTYLLRVYFVSDDEGVKRYIAVVSDMTSVKHQKQALFDALQLAENASKAKSDFLSNMSHEIRTPMNVIINMTDFAKDNIDDKSMLLDCITKVKSSANYLLSLVNDILDMAKIESGQAVLTNTTFNIKELIEEFTSIIAPQAKSKQIQFVVSSHIKDYRVVGDKLKLSKIIINILSNAVKFTLPCGRIWFTISEIVVDDKRIVITFKISDSGIGMDEEFLKVLFEPFTQAKLRNSAKNMGSGLGMAICKNLVTAMHGTIHVSSVEGKGSEFTIDIPFDIADGLSEQEGLDNVIKYDFLGKRVLLVEDNDVNIQIAAVILKRVNVNVDIAKNGQEALDMFVSNPIKYYDAILMDIQMPIMDGLEATINIRKLARGDSLSIPILALSANAFKEDFSKSIASGMNEHLTKPLNPAKLYAILAKYILK